jgi:hypothetical protein
MNIDRKSLEAAGRKGLAAAKWVNAKMTDACEATCPHAPQELKNTIAGVATGLVAGAAIGGVGIAAAGTAVGVSGAAVLAVAGGLVGNRIGISKDRKALRQPPPVARHHPNSKPPGGPPGRAQSVHEHCNP